ncbi:unnamed protein product [Rotaria sp. Silwood2]|nr:unnamed protein product [Rotaria sp. Silwood2]
MLSQFIKSNKKNLRLTIRWYMMCVLPATFPENYQLITRDPSRPKVVISYPCNLLNLLIKDYYTNDQYHELIDKEKHLYEIGSENSIFVLN